MTLQIGILLAIGSALATSASFLLKHRGACLAPDVRWAHPLKSGRDLFRSRWFAIGMGVAVVAWLFHVGALALAPLSLVQAVLAGGLVFLGVLAQRFFGCSVGRRQWAGVALTAAGLAMLAITLPKHGGDTSSFSVTGMIVFQSALLLVGALLVLSPRLGAHHHHHGVLLGAAAGIMFGVSDIALKALTGIVGDAGLIGLISPWVGVALAASVLAFYASAHGLQKGEAVPVITLTAAGANVSAITGGIVVFGDPLPGDPVGIGIALLAFALVIVAAAVTPPPLSAASASASA